MKRHFPFFSPRASLAVVSMIFAALAAAHAESPPTARNLPSLMPAPEFVLKHESDIALSPGQRSQLENAISELQPAAQQSAAQARQESNVLAQLLAHEKPDEAQVAAQFEKVLAAENEAKRVRLKMSLRARAVITEVQWHQLELLQNRTPPHRVTLLEQQEFAEKLTRVKELIERAKSEQRDLGNVRAIWKRVDQATQEGRIADACRILDETANSLTAILSAAKKK